MWDFDAEKNLWFVKRKSDRVEYDERGTKFKSWTRVDLTEHSQAPFHNPSQDPKAWMFKRFVEDQVKCNFKHMPTAKSFTKRVKGVTDAYTGKGLKNVMWPATDKLKTIPNFKPLPEGTLDSMEFWTFDPSTTTAVIKLKNNRIRLIDHRDLLKFAERHIRRLASTQILVENPLFEVAAKPFTGTAAKIVEKGYWAGALGNADVHLLDLS